MARLPPCQSSLTLGGHCIEQTLSLAQALDKSDQIELFFELTTSSQDDIQGVTRGLLLDIGTINLFTPAHATEPPSRRSHNITTADPGTSNLAAVAETPESTISEFLSVLNSVTANGYHFSDVIIQDVPLWYHMASFLDDHRLG